MASTSEDGEIVRVSRKGQATIPKPLRERFGIETPGEVFIYEEDDRLIIEPVPSLEQLRGIHGGDHELGEVVAAVRESNADERRQEAERVERLRPGETSGSTARFGGDSGSGEEGEFEGDGDGDDDTGTEE